MEGADAEESAFDAGVAFVGLSDLVGVAAQSNAGRARFFGHGLGNRGYAGAHDGHRK